ncbi:hypothetical protein ACFSMW_01940 [Virgibacillus halophilus]|uniref:hypothetical protein n=1 Tax=Tigheibacillus halophilus TaxID=361280 RepID=UPI00363C776F
MEQVKYGIILFMLLTIPPVVHLMESIMIIHMHMQMPMIVVAGFLMAPFFQKKFPHFFSKWNQSGIPGILLFSIIMLYWMLPITMDEALTELGMEVFKFFSLAFLAGVPLRDSWKKMTDMAKNVLLSVFLAVFSLMGLLYLFAPVQLCNNYLRIEQITLGWGFVATALCLLIYLLQLYFIDPSEYE